MKKSFLIKSSKWICLVFLFSLCSCRFFEDYMTDDFFKPIQFENPQTIELPKETSYAKKRGFGDFNNDGIEDMYEISDEFIGDDYELLVFLGDTSSHFLKFTKPQKYQLTIKLKTSKWFTAAMKIDVADVNNDGYSDLVLSQYVHKMMGDEVYIKYAINNQKNDFTIFSGNAIVQGKDLSTMIVELLAGYSYDDEKSIYEYLKMDWGDMNGDGKDDLVLLWKDSFNLAIEVFYGEGDGNFSTYESFYVNNFMYNRSIRNVDIENYVGDKKQDILVREIRRGKKMLIRVLENKMMPAHVFLPHKDFETTTTDLDFFAFEKFDSFDIDLDGYADIVHLGVTNDKKLCVYNLKTVE